jgi:Xaa-Pro aminopeptidase
MNNKIAQRLSDLRALMHREHLSAFIFPSTDPHNSEYVADHWKGREWISGFNGSAGVAVVTMKSAALWTDSRYFIAAKEQLEGTGYVLMKERIAGTPSISEWLGKELSDVKSPEVGIDGMVNATATVESLIRELRGEGGITLRTNIDPLQKIWSDRPEIPLNAVVEQPLEFAGTPCKEKLAIIRQSLRRVHADGMLVAALDDIAWTLNLRGSDVHCNPVFVSYLLISTEKATLFVNPKKVDSNIVDYLKSEGVDVDDYKNVDKGLKHYPDYNILIDPNEINYTLYKQVSCHEIVRQQSPIPVLKSVKNDTEIRGFHNAMLHDGIAMVKFLKWLKPAVEAGGQTEISIDKVLTELRSQQPLFKDISFDTIAAYQEHGAIVHYEATPDTDVPLKPEGLILIDSGAQYQNGTTDITRTVALGPITEEQRHIYTLVLKGHIQLELLKFPRGASGTQLDALARKDMWREGINYLHGTGHGVGSYLNVHEGPHQIRMEWKPTPLQPGMTVTDEPGIYLAGRFGVRIENTLIITPYQETEFGEFLQFEPLTLCPIDTAPVDISMMLPEEIEWLNSYNHTVYERLAPHLDEDEKEWLSNATVAI